MKTITLSITTEQAERLMHDLVEVHRRYLDENLFLDDEDEGILRDTPPIATFEQETAQLYDTLAAQVGAPSWKEKQLETFAGAFHDIDDDGGEGFVFL